MPDSSIEESDQAVPAAGAGLEAPANQAEAPANSAEAPDPWVVKKLDDLASCLDFVAQGAKGAGRQRTAESYGRAAAREIIRDLGCGSTQEEEDAITQKIADYLLMSVGREADKAVAMDGMAKFLKQEKETSVKKKELARANRQAAAAAKQKSKFEAAKGTLAKMPVIGRMIKN